MGSVDGACSDSISVNEGKNDDPPPAVGEFGCAVSRFLIERLAAGTRFARRRRPVLAAFESSIGQASHVASRRSRRRPGDLYACPG
ncbi:hypothetical protein HPB50_021958 [Hyalomma asiaticum]|uniref:Uncharacterized protein n=1 Tax=Hyalomma asiaticum TaxID=266040 RepID=A0ACB7TLL9_HYAAI|nr:hypothetical protein HPB50_021958 [Hyalomma asiaticum]